ncbi:MAG: hypothetical protein ABL908_15580 [Hyphomicrobium sp.]
MARFAGSLTWDADRFDLGQAREKVVSKTRPPLGDVSKTRQKKVVSKTRQKKVVSKTRQKKVVSKTRQKKVVSKTRQKKVVSKTREK